MIISKGDTIYAIGRVGWVYSERVIKKKIQECNPENYEYFEDFLFEDVGVKPKDLVTYHSLEDVDLEVEV